MNKLITIERELGDNDATIAIYEEPDGSIILTVAQPEGANKDSTAVKIAKVLVDIAIDDLEAANTNNKNKEPQITSYQNGTIN